MSVSELVPLTGQATAVLRASTSPLDLLRRLLVPDGSVAAALRAIGADPAALRERVPAESQPASCEHVRNCAYREAILLGHKRTDLIHLFMALLYTDIPTTSEFLRREGIGLYDLRTYLQGPATARQTQRLRSAPLPSLREAVRVGPLGILPAAVMVAAGVALYVGVPAALLRWVTALFVVAGWITSLCLHEFGHAVAAYLGGDRSVVEAGYLTLNPLKYTHPVLSVVLPMAFVLLGGVGLPGGAVYVDRSALRGKGWDALVSAAGPLATLLFALAAALPFLLGLGSLEDAIHHLAFWAALAFLVVLELGALLLNLFPIPPLDGFGILAPLLSWETRLTAARLGNLGILVVFFLLWQGPVADAFWHAVQSLAGGLHVPALLADLGRYEMTLFGR
ncbi:MAG TPA: site-2 protease family protein [Candidatus Dormibacteraeota bacterium]|nr:site-2 protease family protein [Candidatus Dormibacteraeota bacterium]